MRLLMRGVPRLGKWQVEDERLSERRQHNAKCLPCHTKRKIPRQGLGVRLFSHMATESSATEGRAKGLVRRARLVVDDGVLRAPFLLLEDVCRHQPARARGSSRGRAAAAASEQRAATCIAHRCSPVAAQVREQCACTGRRGLLLSRTRRACRRPPQRPRAQRTSRTPGFLRRSRARGCTACRMWRGGGGEGERAGEEAGRLEVTSPPHRSSRPGRSRP